MESPALTCDLVLERLAIGREIVHPRNRPSRLDTVKYEAKVGQSLRELLLGYLRVISTVSSSPRAIIIQPGATSVTHLFREARQHDTLRFVPFPPG